jgi:hypothetical protein
MGGILASVDHNLVTAIAAAVSALFAATIFCLNWRQLRHTRTKFLAASGLTSMISTASCSRSTIKGAWPRSAADGARTGRRGDRVMHCEVALTPSPAAELPGNLGKD